MKIIDKGARIRAKYGNGNPRSTSQIDKIIIHGTGASMGQWATFKYVLTPLNADQKTINTKTENDYKNYIGQYHYLNDRKGKIYQMIHDNYWVFHSDYGQGDKKTIGIESTCKEQNKGSYKTKQYKSLAKLIAYLVKKYPSITKVQGHDYVLKSIAHKDPKGCPDGTKSDTEKYFKWTKLNKYLNSDHNLNLVKIGGHNYELGPLPEPPDPLDIINNIDYSLIPPSMENSLANFFYGTIEPFETVDRTLFQFLANENFQIEFTMLTGPPDLIGQVKVISSSTPMIGAGITPVTADKIKIGDKCALDSIAYTWTPPICPFTTTGTNPAGTFMFVGGNGSIMATTLKNKNALSGMFLLRQEDIGTCTGTPPLGGWASIPPGSTLPCSCSVRISSAGQVKVQGN